VYTTEMLYTEYSVFAIWYETEDRNARYSAKHGPCKVTQVTCCPEEFLRLYTRSNYGKTGWYGTCVYALVPSPTADACSHGSPAVIGRTFLMV
jgi:hypothetical protein